MKFTDDVLNGKVCVKCGARIPDDKIIGLITVCEACMLLI